MTTSYCQEAKLIIEVDGCIYKNIEQKNYDEDRTAILNQHELKVIRFTNKEVESNLDEVLRKIENVLPHPQLLSIRRGES